MQLGFAHSSFIASLKTGFYSNMLLHVRANDASHLIPNTERTVSLVAIVDTSHPVGYPDDGWSEGITLTDLTVIVTRGKEFNSIVVNSRRACETYVGFYYMLGGKLIVPPELNIRSGEHAIVSLPAGLDFGVTLWGKTLDGKQTWVSFRKL